MLEITLTSSVLILIIILLRAVCRKSIKPTLRYAIWLIVAVRLVLPLSLFSSNASVMNLFGMAGMAGSPAQGADLSALAPSGKPYSAPAAEADDDGIFLPGDTLSPTGKSYTNPIIPVKPDSDIPPYIGESILQQTAPELINAPEDPLDKPQGKIVQPQAVSEASSIKESKPLLSLSLLGISIEIQPWLSSLAKSVWLVAAAALGMWFLGVNIAFSASLRKGRRELDVSAPLKVYALPSIDSPFLFGLFRPAVYVSEGIAENNASLRFVLAHEYCHYRHGDMFWSLLRCILVSVYWFNPLVWAAAYLSKQDCEYSCDEAAIRLLGEDKRIGYGKTLISMIPQRRSAPRLIGVASTSMYGSKRVVRERVKLIAKRPKNAVFAVLLTVAVLIAAVGCTFTSANDSGEKDVPGVSDDSGKSDDSMQNDSQPNQPSAMKIERCDSDRYSELLQGNVKTYCLPINLGNGSIDCRIDVSVVGDTPESVYWFGPPYYNVSAFSYGHDSCYIHDNERSKVYCYNVTTGECVSLLPESYGGYSREEFEKYFEEHKDYTHGSMTRKWATPYSASADSVGKWLVYESDKWVENGEISPEKHTWLHNVRTGEELLFDDLIAGISGENFIYRGILPDDKLLVSSYESNGSTDYYVVDIFSGESKQIVSLPEGVFSFVVSDEYILTIDGDITVYGIADGSAHRFEAGVDDYDIDCLVKSECVGDCLSVTPSPDKLFVINLETDVIQPYEPSDDRLNVKVEKVCEDKVLLSTVNRISGRSTESYAIWSGIQPEPAAPDSVLRLYGRQVEFSLPEYQKYVPEVYDMTPIYEILGEESADSAVNEYYRLSMTERLSVPPLYRILNSTGITREQLSEYNESAQNRLSDDVISALFLDDADKVSNALIGEFSVVYGGEIYSLVEAGYKIRRELPVDVVMEFAKDIGPYMTDGFISDPGGVLRVVNEYIKKLEQQ